MFNVNGMAYITNMKEVSPKLVVGDVYTFRKINEEHFNTTFVKARLVGEALTFVYANGIKNKDKVFIESAILESNKYTTKEGKLLDSLELTIFKLSSLQNNNEINKTKFDR